MIRSKSVQNWTDHIAFLLRQTEPWPVQVEAHYFSGQLVFVFWVTPMSTNFIRRRQKSSNQPTYGETNVKHSRHASENRSIHILRSVGCTHNHDVTRIVCHQTIPESHELCFHQSSCFMISGCSWPQERVWKKISLSTADNKSNLGWSKSREQYKSYQFRLWK